MSNRNSARPATAQSQNTVIPAKAGISDEKTSFNAQRLLELYDRVADAPDAVERLRQFVLDLAVRGRLVEQDPADEPASALLEKIAEEKQRLLRAKAIRKPKAVTPLNPDDISYSAPNGWEWAQIAQIGVLSPRNEADDDVAASFVPMPKIAAKLGVPHEHEVRPWGEIKKGYTHFADGDVGLAKITPCFENGKSTVFRNLSSGIGAGTTELHIVRPIFLNADYVLLFLKSPQFIETGIPRMTGTAGQKRVPSDYFAASPFPLPPLAEQQRIVAKVNDLMALLDRLETTHTRRESTRNRLTTASLTRLTAPETTEADFPTHARFALDNLDELTYRPEQIKVLRETILNLAVKGKLVEQDPEDKAASEVLSTWIGEKLSHLTKSQRSPVVEAWSTAKSAIPHELPSSWVWATAEELCEEIIDCPHSTPKFSENGIACLDTNSIKSTGLLVEKIRYVSEQTSVARNKRLTPREGDVVFAREGSVGESVIVPAGLNCCLGQRVMLFRPSRVVSPEWFKLAISERALLLRLMRLHRGIGAKHVNVKDMRLSLQPLPPLAEQHRIVAKVDALMARFERLEASLAQADTSRNRLFETLLKEAFLEDMASKGAA